MRRSVLASLFVVLALAGTVAAVRAGDMGTKAAAAGKSVTVRGEILDMACFVSHDAHGAAHAACADKCLKSGQPMGLLANDGTVYLLFADHADATAYNEARGLGGKNVEIRGEIASNGALKGITIESVKAI